MKLWVPKKFFFLYLKTNTHIHIYIIYIYIYIYIINMYNKFLVLVLTISLKLFRKLLPFRYRVSNVTLSMSWITNSEFCLGLIKLETLSDFNWTWTRNHLAHKRTLNHLASLAKWLSVRLWTNWMWVRVRLKSLKLQISQIRCLS